ncbi:MAG: hypothetical protein Q9183_005707 [Haloplaca sp. 2 TL-2023]
MNSQLFARALGSTGSETLQRAELSRQLHAIQAAPGIQFDGYNAQIAGNDNNDQQDEDERKTATESDGRRSLISGSADATIKLWDLEQYENTKRDFTNRPAGAVKKSSSSHQYGITHVSFYPFDSLAFLSSSYDHTLKMYATETMTASATFDLDSVVYSHSLSPIADHLLVACATQHSAVRLVDLRSGASTHSLAGHQRAILSAAWSPHEEYILASGSADGTVRLWDIRRSANSLGVLDLDDAVGIVGEDGLGKNARLRTHGKAHSDAVNGVVWTDDGRHLVTAGHDERVRVWDMDTGANALSHFGPSIKNTHLSTLLPLLVPSHVVQAGKQVMFYPNQKEILMFDLFDGVLFKRLRVPGAPITHGPGKIAQSNTRSRTTSLTWRPGDVGLYSAHSDGAVRAWLPRTQEDVQAENEDFEEPQDAEEESRKRKREALDEAFRDLARQKITFT